jgi:hypothetical protein
MESTVFWDEMPMASRASYLVSACTLYGFMLDLFFGPEDEYDMFLRNVG